MTGGRVGGVVWRRKGRRGGRKAFFFKVHRKRERPYDILEMVKYHWIQES